MNKKSDQYDSIETNYMHIIKNNITPLDLFIISKMNEGLKIHEIAKLAKKDFNIKDTDKIVRERFKKLFSDEKPESGVIVEDKPMYVINPSKLYNNVLLIFIKAKLDPAQNKHLDIGIKNIFDTIVNINNKPRFGKPIKQLFTATGWKYDFVGIVYENNIGRFNSFRNYLIDEGIADEVQIIPIDTDRGFLFNPITIPDIKNFMNFLVNYRDRMNTMIDELSKKDYITSKTMRFFDKYDYGLKVITGKNKDDIYPIDIKELKIGRYHDNDIIIQDIDVSRRHAKISKIGNQFIFQDQSTNGSYVNNKKILFNEIELKDGDIIKIGKNKFKFQKLNKDKK